jgi:hypothetical protein
MSELVHFRDLSSAYEGQTLRIIRADLLPCGVVLCLDFANEPLTVIMDSEFASYSTETVSSWLNSLAEQLSETAKLQSLIGVEI